MRHRRRGPRSAWNWAARGNIVMTDNGDPGAPIGISDPAFLPAGRVDWLLESGRGREHLTVTGILLWLDFYVLNEDDQAVHPMVGAMDFAIIKGYDDGTTTTPALSGVVHPFNPPATPSNVTNWSVGATDENDGLDPYLWTHTMNPALSSFRSWGTANGFAPILAQQVIGGQPQVANDCPLAVRAGWQPDVHIKTRRRMRKRENLTFCMTAASGLGNGLQYNLNYSVRILTT